MTPISGATVALRPDMARSPRDAYVGRFRQRLSAVPAGGMKPRQGLTLVAAPHDAPHHRSTVAASSRTVHSPVAGSYASTSSDRTSSESDADIQYLPPRTMRRSFTGSYATDGQTRLVGPIP